MTRALLLLAALAGILGCGDDIPSREQACTASCEERGGEFYMTDGEYCYCQWTDGFDGGAK